MVRFEFNQLSLLLVFCVDFWLLTGPAPLLSPAAAAAAHQVVLTAGLQLGGGMLESGGQTE